MNPRKKLIDKLIVDLPKAWSDYLTQGTYRHIRFGQFYVNTHLPEFLTPWPDLFYETNDTEAYSILYQRLNEISKTLHNDVYSLDVLGELDEDEEPL